MFCEFSKPAMIYRNEIILDIGRNQRKETPDWRFPIRGTMANHHKKMFAFRDGEIDWTQNLSHLQTRHLPCAKTTFLCNFSMPVAAAILSTARFEERFLVDYSFNIS